MARRQFDQKFGDDFHRSLPVAPGVYRIFDSQDRLVYIGKAKNIRRRLGQYRNAKRCKKHRKMKKIVADAVRIEIEICASDLEACLLETRLIQAHRPRWNVAGAFHFLYPMIGLRADPNGGLRFCYTTRPELFPDYQMHGAFRSREITGEAFFSLMKLFEWVGHPQGSPSRLPRSYAYAFRRLPTGWDGLWGAFWKGESRQALEDLVLALLENAGARRSRGEVQERLDTIARFWKHEALPLRKAVLAAKESAWPIPQSERDLLFLRFRHRAPTPESVASSDTDEQRIR